MTDYDATIKIIRKKAPMLDISELEQLIDKDKFSKADEYVVDRIFGNGLGSIPKNFPHIQKAYFDLALYYYKNKDCHLEDPKATTSLVLSNLSAICDALFNPSMLRKTLGESTIYEKTAKDIIDFHSEKRKDIKLLLNLGDNLANKYIDIVFEEDYEQKDPSIVKEIWQNIKKKALKNE